MSTNPILGFLGILLVLAWRIAGYWGLDRWLLPLLGTPWTGRLHNARADTSPGNVPVQPSNGRAGHRRALCPHSLRGQEVEVVASPMRTTTVTAQG